MNFRLIHALHLALTYLLFSPFPAQGTTDSLPVTQVDPSSSCQSNLPISTHDLPAVAPLVLQEREVALAKAIQEGRVPTDHPYFSYRDSKTNLTYFCELKHAEVENGKIYLKILRSFENNNGSPDAKKMIYNEENNRYSLGAEQFFKAASGQQADRPNKRSREQDQAATENRHSKLAKSDRPPQIRIP